MPLHCDVKVLRTFTRHHFAVIVYILLTFLWRCCCSSKPTISEGEMTHMSKAEFTRKGRRYYAGLAKVGSPKKFIHIPVVRSGKTVGQVFQSKQPKMPSSNEVNRE